MSLLRLATAASLLPLLAAGCQGVGDAPPEERPSLIVLVSVDQLRGDLLAEYGDLFTGGLRRLLDEGASWPNTTHDHSETSTAPGHTTLATAVYPSRHGITGNSWFEEVGGQWRSVYAVEDSLSPLLADPELPGRSPANLYREGLGDWVKQADPSALAVAVSRKDRASITMGGLAADHVYWLALGAGVQGFTTSTYYSDELPAWVTRVNSSLESTLWADTLWQNEIPEGDRARARGDALETEGDGVHVTFPHRASAEARDTTRRSLGRWLEGTPSQDVAVFQLAEAALTELQLGQRGSVDYLALGLSATDAIGHAYGPRSQEQLDNLLRLDRELGAFLNALDEIVGTGRWVVALSADHGVVDMVEARNAAGLPGHRITSDEQLQMRSLAADLRDNPAALALALEELPFVADVLTLDEVRSAAPATDSFMTLFRNSDVEGRGVGPFAGIDVLVRFEEGTYGSPRGTGHGTPYYYDRSVPFLLLGPGVTPGVRSDRAATVDIAPTLAALGGISVPDDLNGTAREP
jgi:predicted AlkP superfamily pyrophosphatase or phosphodiesterase